MCSCRLAGSLSVHGQWEAAWRLSYGCSPVEHSSSEYDQWSAERNVDLETEIGNLNDNREVDVHNNQPRNSRSSLSISSASSERLKYWKQRIKATVHQP